MAYSGYEMNKDRIMQMQRSAVPHTKPESVGFREGVVQLGMLVATPFLMFGVPAKLGYAGGALLGSKAYRYYGYAKYPVLSAGKHYGVRGASTTLSLVKAYGKLQTGVGILYYKKNLQLAQQREWKRLGINVFGPPGSLYMYDNYLADTSNSKQEETALVEAIKEQSRRDGSLPSKSKTRGNGSYKPSNQKIDDFFTSGGKTNPCRKGYKFSAKRMMCVRK